MFSSKVLCDICLKFEVIGWHFQMFVSGRTNYECDCTWPQTLFWALGMGVGVPILFIYIL